MFGKTGIKYSLKGKLNKTGLRVDKTCNAYLNQQRLLPGPGSYNQPDLVANSMFASSRKSSFPKTEFKFPDAK
jgi:hypothetical protein